MNAKELRILAPAKLNLTLRVLGERPDGFHEIESWVVKIDWGDELTIRKAERLALCVTAEASVPRDEEPQPSGRAAPLGESNLVWRAATALAGAHDQSRVSNDPVRPGHDWPGSDRDLPRGASIELLKRVPVGAGLGGGSSDAAATLRALNEWWGLDWPVERLAELAAEIGSDVPLFLAPGPVVVRGRGERVERLGASWRGWAVVVVPPFGVSTAEVYGRWRAASTASARRDARPWMAGATDAATLLPLLFNDLETPAFLCEPRLSDLHAKLDGLAGRPVRMTGSGSCLFTLFDEAAEAEAWREAAARQTGPAVRLRVVEVL